MHVMSLHSASCAQTECRLARRRGQRDETIDALRSPDAQHRRSQRRAGNGHSTLRVSGTASDCFSPKKDGNATHHSHHSSGHRRTPLLEGKEHRQSIAFSTSFTPVIPGGCTHRQREAAKYNEASESTSNSRQGHLGSSLRRGKPGTSSSHKPSSGRAATAVAKARGTGGPLSARRCLQPQGGSLLPVELEVGHQTQPRRGRRRSRERIVPR